MPVQHVMSFFMPGSFAVAIFIVLSGYCLMLPVVRSGDFALRGGAANYLKRRAHRILPPYYAALALSLLFMACFTDLRRATGIQTQLALPTNSTNFLHALIAHITLFHNLNYDWAFQIQLPMWSVGTEWQIYFLFPWILLPMWRKFGTMAPIIAGYGAGIALHFVLRGFCDCAAPWFIGLFAMGMAGAAISFSPRPFEAYLRDRLPWGLVALCGTVGLLAMALQDELQVLSRRWRYGRRGCRRASPGWCTARYIATLTIRLPVRCRLSRGCWNRRSPLSSERCLIASTYTHSGARGCKLRHNANEYYPAYAVAGNSAVNYRVGVDCRISVSSQH